MKKLTTILMLFCMCLFTVHCSAVTDIYKSTLYKSTFYASSYTPPVGSTPVLFFSDLISGPATGNTDTSLGQSSGVHGSIVTVWGKNLGSSQGTSTITCNGVVAPYVYMWGNNTFPLELNTKRGWQMISFQVASTATSGAGTIYATVGGINTNTLAFTVRTGSIYYLKTTGNNTTGNGSWSTPWQTWPGTVGHIVAGDIIYWCDGVNQLTVQSNNRCVNVSKIGSEGNSSAIIAYPGATCMIGLSGYKSIGSFVSGYGAVPWWTFSKFNLVSGAQVCKGWRIIGNTLTAPTGTGKTAGMEGGGWYGDSIVPSTSRPTDPGDMKILGNVLFQVGKVDASKYFHNIYINNHSGYTNANIEIGWNIIRDSTANRGVQIFSDGTGTADIGPGSIHDNLFYNLRSNPINLSNHATGTWNVYNNIIYHSGYGPDFYDGDAVYIGVLVDSSLNDATINFYNNIVYDVGKSSKPTESGCIALGTTFGGTLIPKNNIFYALSWQEYFVSVGYTFPSASAYNNLFYGSTDTFSWDTSALNADPQFVDLAGKDFHLITGSPAIDAGLDTTATVVYDYDGVTRPQNTTVDIGAYEQ